MVKKVLIVGLPESGKTTLMNKFMEWAKIDGTEMRRFMNDWDFSLEGRKKQAERLGLIASISNRDVVVSYICPTHECMEIFLKQCPDVFVIWMDTIKTSRYPDTNKMWQEPKYYDMRIKDFDYDMELIRRAIT